MISGHVILAGKPEDYEDVVSGNLPDSCIYALHKLEVKDVAHRLGVAVSTLNAWLKEDEGRDSEARVFAFHRRRGRIRRWSEKGYLALEAAIHRESENGILSLSRNRNDLRGSPSEAEAEAALAEVLKPRLPKPAR